MANLTIESKYKTSSGYEIPVLGYGVYQTPSSVASSVTQQAFKVGYRHVDSARVYRNEGPCAEAIRKSGIPRSQIYFTSKIPSGQLGYEPTRKSIDATFSTTGLDYIDLMLIHAPYGGKEARLGAWKALVEAQKAGRIRSIGVSNYGVHHLDELEAYIKNLESEGGPGAGGGIDVGQWELHPWLARSDIVEWARKRNVVIEAYSPLVRGERWGEPSLKKLSEKHQKTEAQILLRWSLQKGFVPLPKSVTEGRIKANAELYDFELDKEDMKTLETGDYAPCTWDPTVSRD